MFTKIKNWIAPLVKWINQGQNPLIITIVFLALSTLWVYASPRSLPAFLLLLLSAGLIYALKLKPKVKLLLGLMVALVIMPIIGVRNIFYLEVLFQIGLFSALALGLNIVVGFTGLLNMGYVAFYAVGAYLWGFFGSQQMYLLDAIPGTVPPGTPFLLPGDMFYLFILLGIIVAAVVGLLLGLPVLRVRGDYLAIVTLAFGEVIRQAANNLDKPVNLTNGPQGIASIQRPSLPQEVVDAINVILAPLVGRAATQNELYNVMFYFIAMIVAITIIVVTMRLDDSKIGRAWTAIREDELAAVAMGIPAVKMKLAAFAVGASFAGAMGVLLAASRTFISPESFNFMQSIGVLAMVILGGIGSIPGVVLGAAVVTVLNLQILQGLSLYLAQLRQSDAVIPVINFAWKNLSNQLDPAKYQRLFFGLILILMMIYRPDGLIPAKRTKKELVRDKENGDGPPVEAVEPAQEVNHG